MLAWKGTSTVITEIGVTHCNKAASSPLLSALLHHFQEVSSVVVISDKMGAVDNQDQGRAALFAPLEGDLLKLVEGAFDVQQCCCVTGPSDTEKATNVTKGDNL